MSTLGAYFRLARAGWVMVREGVVAALPGDELEGPARLGWRFGKLLARNRARQRERSERIAKAIERLGPSYVKLGQFLATRPDVVGHDIALDLATLQDRMATFPRAASVTAIEGSIGQPVSALYATLDEPVAAASIGSGSVCSSGQWLRPPRDGTNSIPAGTCRAMTPAS